MIFVQLPYLLDFLNLLDSLLEDLIKENTHELEKRSLDIASLKEIVLASEDEIIHIAEQLKEINSLKDDIDIPILEGSL